MMTVTKSRVDERWQAVLKRDRRFDGEFILGVTTTGIYCRPSCPARKPKRENVTFFESIEDARRAGLRPCKRCKPDEAFDPQTKTVTQLRNYIEANLDEPLTLTDLGERVGLSAHHVQKMFKKTIGVSPKQYANACRMAKFKQEVGRDGNVTRALYAAGFSSSSRLYESSSARLGMTPAAYGNGGKGATIYYAILNSKLGPVIVAATERGLCFVALGQNFNDLTQTLIEKFPKAKVMADADPIADWVDALKNYLNGDAQALNLPLDVKATAFQLEVWSELRRIPYGQTRSYGEVANAIGRPTASRAVARACASNPVALVTPCHRVVRSDGAEGGYRWGTWRKRTLLEMERSRSE